MRRTIMVMALTTALVGVAAAPAAEAAAGPQRSAAIAEAPAPGTLTSAVDGTFTDATGNPGTVTGTFTPSSFSQQGDQAVATGTLVTNLVDSTGQSLGTQTSTVSVPLESAAAAPGCQILDLVLGPLDLNLLGLTVHLDQVHLNITAIPGAGNLLGNLLCAVAGLLDGPGGLAQLVATLNRILALLGLLGGGLG